MNIYRDPRGEIATGFFTISLAISVDEDYLEIFIPPKLGFVDLLASTKEVVLGLLVILKEDICTYLYILVLGNQELV